MLRYVIPDIPPSNNRFKGRKNCWEYRKLKKEWAQTAAIYCRPKPSAPLSGVTVRITYFFPTRIRHDPDNYNGVFLLDGMVRVGILRDDSFACISLELRGGYDKGNPRTVIEIFERDEKPHDIDGITGRFGRAHKDSD